MTAIQVCRTCLAYETSMHTIANTPLQFFYEKITNLTLNTKDGRSSVVCDSCNDLLNKCYNLSEIAIKADGVLQQICKNGIEITHQYMSMIDRAVLCNFNNSSVPVINSNSKMAENFEMVHVKEEILSDHEQDVLDEDATEAPKNIDPELTEHFEIKIETELDLGREILSSEDALESKDQLTPDLVDVPLDISIKKENGVEEESVPARNGQDTPGLTQLKLQQTLTSPERPQLQSSSKNDKTNTINVKPKRIDKGKKKNELKKKKYRQKEFACSYCDYKSNRKYDMTRHNRRIHINEMPYECSHCDHESSKDQDSVCQMCDKPFTCDHCHKRFTLKSDLSRHLRIHTDENPYTCNYCGSKFSQKSNLSRHISTHWGEKPFTCTFCGNKFTQKSNLSRHIRIHRGEKPFTCSFCEKTYSQKIHLTQHLMTHTGEKPYTCNYCDKKFSQKRVLTGHVRMHRGEKPFTCKQCGSKFAQKSYLSRHFRTHMSKDSGNY